MSVSRLGYVLISATEPAAWRQFGTEILGLAAVEGDADEVRLKMDNHPYRILVQPGETDRLTCAGWELDSEADFEAAMDRLTAAGAAVTRGDAAGATLRCVTDYAQTTDPDGNGIEIYYGRTGVGEAFESPLGVKEFLTGDMGLGHIVIPAPSTDQVHQFYTDVLGFADSDDLSLPPFAEGMPDQRVVFMHAKNPRHHSLALYNFPVPTGVVHLMLEVPDIDTVGACLDRVNKAELPLMATLGRHFNDNMLSFYVVGPGGMAVEYGCEGLQVDWDQFTPTQSTQADIWGHAYAPPPVE